MEPDRKVAVTGIGCRLPGGISCPADLWRVVEEGRNVIGPMPPGRFAVDRFLDPKPGTPGKIVTREGGFLTGIDRFDAAFFGISPREAKKMDPQHRLLLELAWEALEDAAIVPATLAGSRTGVFIGLWSSEYEMAMASQPADIDLYSNTGGGRFAAAGRISFALDLRGPSMTVDTACSSSLVAVHLACQALRDGEVDVALVGAANLILHPYISIGYSRSGMLSPAARCRFGAPAPDGYVRSEGVAMLVLKPLENALHDNDPIHVVIRGSAVSSDGRGSGNLVAPSEEAQADMLRYVYGRAGLAPKEVAYMEAHGTGTAAGDGVELRSMGSVVGRPGDRPLPVGSVKTLLGHTEAAAGLAGLIKAGLILKNRVVPADQEVVSRDPTYEWDRQGLEIPTASRQLEAEPSTLYAGVNSFGLAGTNSHVVLESAPPMPAGAPAPHLPHVVCVSGHVPEVLDEAVARLARHVDETDIALADLAYTTASRRTHHAHRLAFPVHSMDELRDALKEVLEGRTPPGVARGTTPLERSPRVAFVFSGQGAQWRGMGKELMAAYPIFHASLLETATALKPFVPWSLVRVVEGEEPMDDIGVIQPTLGALQIAMARLLASFGVRPDVVLGHSMGEVAAAHLSGALDVHEAMLVLATRSRLLGSISGRGGMALIDESADEVLSRLQPFGDRLSIASMNGPRSTVVAGDSEALDQILSALESEGVFSRRVLVDVASHSAQTDPLLDDLVSALSGLAPCRSNLPFHSTVRAAHLEGEALDAGYWASNLRQPVRLDETVGALVEDGVDVFVEIAPHPILLSSLADIASARDARPTLVPLGRREEREVDRLVEGLARMHTAGAPVAWDGVQANEARAIRLPPYPWKHESYWLDEWPDWSHEGGAGRALPPLRDEDRAHAYVVRWEPLEEMPSGARPLGFWAILGHGTPIERCLEELIRAAGGDAVVLDGGADCDVTLRDLHDRLGGVIDVRPAAVAENGSAPFAAVLEKVGRETLSTIQALISSQPTLPGGTWWVTRDCQGPGTSGLAPATTAQAAVWGLARTLWQEHPELDPHLVDLEGGTSPEEMAEQVLSLISADSRQDQVAFRGGRPMVPRLVRAPPSVFTSGSRWRADSSYLITGGLGELGLEVARVMVEGGAKRVVLASRTPMPLRTTWATQEHPPSLSRRIEKVRALEQLGASVHLLALDVADDAALRTALSEFKREGWPPVRGVIHCAGTLDNHLLRDLTWESFWAVASGKAVGAWNLHELFPKVEETVYFSSVVPILPQAGQGNYAAANACLDGLAAVRSAAGAPTVSLGWGPWQRAGLVRDDKVARSVERMEAEGLAAFAPEHAANLFTWAAPSDHPHVAIARVDWSVAAERLSRRPGASFYTELLGAGDVNRDGGLLAAHLSTLSEERRVAELETRLRELAAAVLGIADGVLPTTQPLGRRGLDSLMAMELRNRMELLLDLRLPASTVWNYPTVEQLARHLAGRLPGVAEAVHDEGAASPDSEAAGVTGDAEDLISEVRDASDDEVLRALRGDR